MSRKSIAMVTTVAALRGLWPIKSKDLARVETGDDDYVYDSESLSADDGDLVVKPSARLTTQRGRWLRRIIQTEDFDAEGLGLLKDPGRRAINVLRVAANVADEETVTIGADVYEFDRAEDGVTTGRIAVTGHAGDTPAAATDALVAAINASGTEDVEAVDIGDNEILIVADEVGAVELACTETMDGTDNAWASATMYGGGAPALKVISTQTRTPNDIEKALGTMHFMFDFEPIVLGVVVTPAETSQRDGGWDGEIIVDGNRVTLTPDPTLPLDDMDAVSLIVVQA